MKNLPVPTGSIEVFSYIFCIEVVLRELIIESLEPFGPKWFKQRLPPDLTEKYIKGITYERSIKWTQMTPHHPIYYLDFPDLVKILRNSRNWNEVFKSIFLREEIVASSLSEIEPVRNKIAHNRIVNDSDIELVRAAYTTLVWSIGEERMETLVLRRTSESDIVTHIKELYSEMERAWYSCERCEIIDNLSTWTEISVKWWFVESESYLGHRLDETRSFFQSMIEYDGLPRVRGSGYKIESWTKENNIYTKYMAAVSELKSILS